MMRSLFAGVSGLRNHQTRMDVIANNVANVNTTAYKASRITFKEGFAQLLQGASRPPGDHGGINPIQIGLGMQVGSIDQVYSQGNIETTGQNTDLAIQGDAFFVVRKGDAQYYTRSGNFQMDADGRMVSPTNGFIVQGRSAVQGELVEEVGDIQLPFGQKTEAKVTDYVRLTGNLDSATEIGDTTESAVTVYDSLGARHEVRITFEKTADNQWGWSATCDTATLGYSGGATGGTLNFGAGGLLDPATSTIPNIQLTDVASGGADISFRLDAGDGGVLGITQFAASNSAVLRDQNGYGMGDLANFSIDRSGKITGFFSNGKTVLLGQIALADFNNPSGLQRTGDNMYVESGNSGSAVLGYALEGSTSFMTSGALEMSNVDIANEFTNMISTQRGYQVSGRIITTSDEMLQEVVNLKR